MKSPDWKDTAELIGITAIVASLIFVGFELKQNRDIAVASASDATTAAWREMNYVRMNADWYWDVVAKLNSHLNEPGPYLIGIPNVSRDRWVRALEQLTAEEYGRFQSFHLQEMNEAQRLFNQNKLGIFAGTGNYSYLVSIRAPLWTALFSVSEDSEFNSLIIQYADGGQE